MITVVIHAFAITDVGGVIATNTVWGPTGNPPDTVYNLISNVFVLDTVTLTIQPGVRIQASNSFCIQIYGRIIACGTTQDSITFTSSQSTPSTGDWHGIWFVIPNTDSSRLEYCIIEYAQYGIDRGTVFILKNSLIRYCNQGLSLINGGFIHNNEITTNTVAGITVGTVDTLPPIISDNVISNNPWGIAVGNGSIMPCYIVLNYFFGNNVGIEILGIIFEITDEMTWNPAVGGIECILWSSIHIGELGKLTIAAGNTFKIHGTMIIVYGQLFACGTADSKITFTSVESLPNPGDWDGIWFAPSATDSSKLEHCIIEYGHGITASLATPLRISHSIVRQNQIDGIFCSGNTIIDSCQIYENLVGISYGGSYIPGPRAYFAANTISNNDYGIFMGSGTITLPIFQSPNQFSNNTKDIYIEGNVIIQDEYLWNPAVGGVACEVFGEITVDTMGIFTIMPGNTFKLLWKVTVNGQLIASGTEQSKITFTSRFPDPAPGDWSEIVFWEGAHTGIMEHCIVEYSNWGISCHNDSMVIRNCVVRNSNCGIGCASVSGIIENCQISNNEWFGILVTSPSTDEKSSNHKPIIRYSEKNSMRSDTVLISNNTISNNELGIWCQFGGNPHVESNEIYGNTEWGMYNEDNNYWIYAENNWWGDSTGPRDTSIIDTLYNPNGLGDRVSDHVDYDPWVGFTACEEDPKTMKIVESTAIQSPHPNPFFNTIILSYDLAEKQHVMCTVYNALGQAVRKLCNMEQSTGKYRLFWNGKDSLGRLLPAGVYWLRFETPVARTIHKIVKIE